MNAFTICATVALFLGCVSATPLSSRIVGGNDAEVEAAPFIVSLQWVTQTRRQHFCAAAIIDDEWILSAAHCIQALPVDSVIKAVAGKKNLNEEDTEEHQIRYVNRIIVHENFTGGISSDDLALLRLQEPLEWTETVQPIEIQRTKNILLGSAQVFGWGSTSKDIIPEFPDVLQEATMDILPFSECEEVLGGAGATPLKTTNICTGPLEGGVSSCNGDSGGPLVKVSEEGHPTLIGIVSWGFYPCGGANTPSIYVNVASYVNWIEEMKK